MGTTNDPADPRLGRGADSEPRDQNEVYLVMSKEERERGFVRPVRRKYIHWTKADGKPVPVVVINANGFKGCGGVTRMGLDIAETYARDPHSYGSTYCVHCRMHLPVSEFTWDGAEELVGS